MPITLTIASLEKILFEGKVTSLTLPGTQGELTILPGHVPVITALKKGVISAIIAKGERYEAGEKKYFESNEGIFEFANNEATILV